MKSAGIIAVRTFLKCEIKAVVALSTYLINRRPKNNQTNCHKYEKGKKLLGTKYPLNKNGRAIKTNPIEK